jgi:hypothetical protein
MLAYRVAMLVRPGDRFAGQYATWSEIWRRRREWQQGFGKLMSMKRAD